MCMGFGGGQVLHKSCWPSGTEERNLCQHSKYTGGICLNSSLVLGRDLRRGVGGGGFGARRVD